MLVVMLFSGLQGNTLGITACCVLPGNHIRDSVGTALQSLDGHRTAAVDHNALAVSIWTGHVKNAALPLVHVLLCDDQVSSITLKLGIIGCVLVAHDRGICCAIVFGLFRDQLVIADPACLNRPGAAFIPVPAHKPEALRGGGYRADGHITVTVKVQIIIADKVQIISTGSSQVFICKTSLSAADRQPQQFLFIVQGAAIFGPTI